MSKNLAFLVFAYFMFHISFGQENLDDLLAAGIRDAKTFTTSYLRPAKEGVAYAITNGWSSNAESLKKYGFRISFIGSASFIKDEKTSFRLNSSDYENVRFEDGSSFKMVATSLGHNDPPQNVIIRYDDPIFGGQEAEITLPTGIGAQNVNLIPSAFLQIAFSPFEGTEIKGRYFPNIETDDTELGIYGIGLQQEFTAWFPDAVTLPIAVSGLISYTHLDGKYDFTEMSVVESANQRVETDVDALFFQLLAGSKFKVLNFYGGLGYLSANTSTDLLGTYVVSNGVLFSEEIKDPFTIEDKVQDLKASLGANLKLAFFSLNADYTFGEFDSASLGLNFTF